LTADAGGAGIGGGTYPDPVIDLFGDSTRCGEWADVRLRLDGDRIVDADADGLTENLRGLTLLEAAAVPGNDLVADALAAAIGPAFRAPASPTRVAVAMSGGYCPDVDAIVTIHVNTIREAVRSCRSVFVS